MNDFDLMVSNILNKYMGTENIDSSEKAESIINPITDIYNKNNELDNIRNTINLDIDILRNSYIKDLHRLDFDFTIFKFLSSDLNVIKSQLDYINDEFINRLNLQEFLLTLDKVNKSIDFYLQYININNVAPLQTNLKDIYDIAEMITVKIYDDTLYFGGSETKDNLLSYRQLEDNTINLLKASTTIDDYKFYLKMMRSNHDNIRLAYNNISEAVYNIISNSISIIVKKINQSMIDLKTYVFLNQTIVESDNTYFSSEDIFNKIYKELLEFRDKCEKIVSEFINIDTRIIKKEDIKEFIDEFRLRLDRLDIDLYTSNKELYNVFDSLKNLLIKSDDVFDSKEDDTIIYNDYKRILYIIKDHDIWNKYCTDNKIFNTPNEADDYIIKYLIRDYKNLESILKKIFSRNYYNLSNNIPKYYDIYHKILGYSKEDMMSISKKDYDFNHFKVFQFLSSYETCDFLLELNFKDVVGIENSLLIRNKVLFNMTKSFVVLDYYKKEKELIKLCDFVLDYCQYEEHKRFSTTSLSIIILDFLYKIAISSVTLNEDIKYNILLLYDKYYNILNDEYLKFIDLYNLTIEDPQFPFFNIIENMTEEKMNKFFDLIKNTQYSDMISYIDYNHVTGSSLSYFSKPEMILTDDIVTTMKNMMNSWNTLSSNNAIQYATKINYEISRLDSFQYKIKTYTQVSSNNGTILNKPINIPDFTNADGKVLKYDKDTDSFILDEDSESYDLKIISTRGSIFRNNEIYTTLIAKVYKGGVDITDTLNSNQFRWTRVSDDAEGDIIWNHHNFSGKKEITITSQDVSRKAEFFCDLL